MRLPKHYAIGTVANGKRRWVKLLDCGGIELLEKLTLECWVPKDVAKAWIKRPHVDPRYKLYEITANVNEYAEKFRQRGQDKPAEVESEQQTQQSPLSE